MSKRTAWRWSFLTLTALVLGMELVAGFDKSDDTEAWTDLLVGYVHGEVIFAMIGALMLWLPVHFALKIWQKEN